MEDANQSPTVVSTRPDVRCCGRTGQLWLQRCRRQGQKRFCADHRFQWLYALLIGVPAAFAYFDTGTSIYEHFKPLSAEERALRREVYTEIGLTVHAWKNAYMGLLPDHIGVALTDPQHKYNDVWAQLKAEHIPAYSRENWQIYLPLFVQGIDVLDGKLQDILAANSDVLTPAMRTLIHETRTQLYVERVVYPSLGPSENGLSAFSGSIEQMFSYRFVETLQTLEKLDHESERMRDLH